MSVNWDTSRIETASQNVKGTIHMKRSFLSAMGLSDEQIDSIMSEHGKTANGLRDEVDGLKDELGNRDKQIKDLQGSTGDAEDLKTKLAAAEQKNTEWQTKYNQSQKTASVKLAVAKDAHDADDIVRFIDIEKLNVKEDGTIEGLDAEVSRLKESKPYLFNVQQDGGQGGDDQGSGENGGQGSDNQQQGGDNQQSTYTPPGGNKKGNDRKQEDPREMALLDIERRHGKKKED